MWHKYSKKAHIQNKTCKKMLMGNINKYRMNKHHKLHKFLYFNVLDEMCYLLDSHLFGIFVVLEFVSLHLGCTIIGTLKV